MAGMALSLTAAVMMNVNYDDVLIVAHRYSSYKGKLNNVYYTEILEANSVNRIYSFVHERCGQDSFFNDRPLRRQLP